MDWGTDDDDDSGGSTPRQPACVEVSDTVGRSVCRRFGSGWDVSNLASMRFSLSPTFRLLRLDEVAFAGSTHHQGRDYQTGNGAHGLHDPALVVGGATARLDVGFLDYFFAGGEVALMGASARGPTRRDGAVRVTPTSMLVPSFGLNVGAALPLDIFTFRPELHLGYRVLSLRSETRVGDCIESVMTGDGQGVVEPRLTAEVFFTPHFSVSGTVGTNLLSPGELYGALTISGHSRAFDGQPR